MKKITNLVFIACLQANFVTGAWGQATRLPDECAYPVYRQVEGVKSPSMTLNGDWQFQYSASSPWTAITVPGEPAMQGYAIRHDQPFTYRKKFTVPSDYAGRRIVLRFDGVYSHAKLSVNGKEVRQHDGGFTRWETDITPFVTPGRENELTLEVADRLKDISYASGYAHHPIGGILRNVTLLAMPKETLYDFYAITELDDQFRDATLRLSFKATGAAGAQVKYTLTNLATGEPVKLPRQQFSVVEGDNSHAIEVNRPLLWDAEHPNLYRLAVSLEKNGKEVASFVKQIGFREVAVDGDRMLVNGRQVKLRGACRHDIHPVLGRSAAAEYDSLDAVMFKRSNMNFVRTSHYPPSEQFLEACDREGVYVECESAVCFVNTYRQKNYAPGNSENDSTFLPQYLSQSREMVKAFRSHPALLFWSIGNESMYGENFRKSYDWIKATDTTRPIIFSYPGTVKNGKPVFDLLSMHYPGVDGNLDQWGKKTHGFQGEGIPALFDEWAHPACYTYETLQNDPNIREFWGKSLDMMWGKLFDARGGLGGAVWCYADETFMLPEPKVGTAFWKDFAHTAKPKDYEGKCVGYGEWGIVDVWRREKPEFWSTKKAYSPVRLTKTQAELPAEGQQLALPVYNRFDHTNLNEITVAYTYRGRRKTQQGPALEPHTRGTLTIPALKWREGEPLTVEFLDAKGELIDKDIVTLGKPGIPASAMTKAKSGGKLTVEETAEAITVKGKGFEIPFNKADGLIHNATRKGKTVIEKGPMLYLDINLNHLSGAEVRKMASRFRLDWKDWQKSSLAYTKVGDNVKVSIDGRYKDVQLNAAVTITPQGVMTVEYSTEGHPNGYVRETGLAFDLPDAYDNLKWERKGYWSSYPEDAFAGNEGETPLYNSHDVAYGANPDQPWNSDTRDYYYWSDRGANCDNPLTRKAKGMKENIYSYSLTGKAVKGGLTVTSTDASVACRTWKSAEGQLRLYIDNRWDYPEIAWGNYCKIIEATPSAGSITMKF